MLSSEELLHGSGETEGLRLAHPGGAVRTDLLDLICPSDLGQEEIGESDPCGIGRDLEDMFHGCAVSCYEDDVDIFNLPPISGGPMTWDDVSSEFSDDYDYVVQEDEHNEFAYVETNCPGRNIPLQQSKKISNAWLTTISERFEQYIAKCAEILRQGEDADLPPVPLEVFPEATSLCVQRSFCYHVEYRTHDTSTTDSTFGCDEPELMLQIFSLRLSGFSLSYPVSLYGVFAVRDVLEPLRNHVFNRSRDDPVTVDRDPFTLPLCSPCRGMYLPYDRALLEVDLWIKREGDGSADQKLISAYVELDVRTDWDGMIYACIPSDSGSLEIDYAYLTRSVEAAIEVSAEVSRPQHVRFVAFSSGYDNEIVMFDDELFGRKVFKHVVAVKAEGELNVRLELEKSLFQWTFKDGNVVAFSSPDDSILKYGQFHVKVCFSPQRCE